MMKLVVVFLFSYSVFYPVNCEYVHVLSCS